jgi:hypothetical protein
VKGRRVWHVTWILEDNDVAPDLSAAIMRPDSKIDSVGIRIYTNNQCCLAHAMTMVVGGNEVVAKANEVHQSSS